MRWKKWGQKPGRGLGLEKKHYMMVKIIPNTSIITKIDNKSFLKKENKKNFLSSHYMPGSQGTETDRQSLSSYRAYILGKMLEYWEIFLWINYMIQWKTEKYLTLLIKWTISSSLKVSSSSLGVCKQISSFNLP